MLLIPGGFVASTAPVVLRLMGLFPANDSPMIFGVIFATNMVGVGLGIVANILFSSMIADVVEDSELKTGRRQEGLFFAAIAFINKAVSGLGIFFSGMIVAAIHFPTGVKPGAVPPEIVRNLGLIYVPIQAVLYGTATLLLIGYGISRSSHHEHPAKAGRRRRPGGRGRTGRVQGKAGLTRRCRRPAKSWASIPPRRPHSLRSGRLARPPQRLRIQYGA